MQADNPGISVRESSMFKQAGVEAEAGYGIESILRLTSRQSSRQFWFQEAEAEPIQEGRIVCVCEERDNPSRWFQEVEAIQERETESFIE